ncbi:hypothetical protein L2D08_05935 [Domibacillus sp. PGB-M46]|uniref:hypothetical protein n=1 Tax=Domibacillus sp. PGB-M46 TaxID=2910255 RepID=UPI001F5AB124|nr:hypothetical protein [Domibacillus sp. PGB-M46]MCI2253900.1 hypothetical protein [Domibacillus sp. PGB-M46]
MNMDKAAGEEPGVDGASPRLQSKGGQALVSHLFSVYKAYSALLTIEKTDVENITWSALYMSVMPKKRSVP